MTVDSLSFFTKRTVVTIILMVVWTIIWFATGLFRFSKLSFIFFTIYPIISLYNLRMIYERKDDSKLYSVYTGTFRFDKNSSQIIALLSVIILLLVLISTIPRLNSLKEANIILYICAIILVICSITIGLKNNIKNIMIIEKILQELYNQAVILFIYFLVLMTLSFRS